MVDGRTFDSKKEAARYQALLLEQQQGLIQNLICQKRIKCIINGQLVTTYIADFVYQKDGKRVVEDVKSWITAQKETYRLKKRLLRAMFNIEIVETI